ncbi:hypothetical protein E2C01_067385 [Portunus trituberculatus]|uniref:Uncharacterized protein n=1 Tax=Portunus trituberculatus TaxID=210409 RepID=A0A5B7HUW3_PORTR|nr:hypothetical protein [Portunus trituberculatus]
MKVKEAEAKHLTKVVDEHVGFQQHEPHAVLHKLNLVPWSTSHHTTTTTTGTGEPQPCKKKKSNRWNRTKGNSGIREATVDFWVILVSRGNQ